tara:strand:- start:968 stop:1552 length:585 start_codon:yes stop_codon:yes gene_type:complete
MFGIFSVFLTGLINPSSFAIHEYYQLPLMIFCCPLMGFGFVRLKKMLYKNNFLTIFLILLSIGSLSILKLDYWDMEVSSRQPVWDTAQLIKKKTKESDLIISITGGDPTLLYLSNRKGWLVSPNDINNERLLEWKMQGAKYVAGSWLVVENYNKFSDNKLKMKLNKLFCSSSIYSESLKQGCEYNDKSFLLKLN